jgi:rod shape determining protein RodA
VLHDYQKARVETFLDPESDALGKGWNITQAKIAIGSGGWRARASPREPRAG